MGISSLSTLRNRVLKCSRTLAREVDEPKSMVHSTPATSASTYTSKARPPVRLALLSALDPTSEPFIMARMRFVTSPAEPPRYIWASKRLRRPSAARENGYAAIFCFGLQICRTRTIRMRPGCTGFRLARRYLPLTRSSPLSSTVQAETARLEPENPHRSTATAT